MFNNKIASKNSSSALKKYCKVCHDAGKSETEYTSHFIRENRDPCSKVVCPTLLSLECRHCSKKGHTVKYCKILEKDKISEARQRKNDCKLVIKPKSEEKYKQANMFSNLESDSEDDNLAPPPITTKVKSLVLKVPNNFFESKDDDLDFRPPPITAKSKNLVLKVPNNFFESKDDDLVCISPNKSYASALLRPTIIPKEVKITLPIPIMSINRKINDFVPSYNNIKSTYIKNKSWADTDSDSDSDSELEEEKEEVNDPNW